MKREVGGNVGCVQLTPQQALRTIVTEPEQPARRDYDVRHRDVITVVTMHQDKMRFFYIYNTKSVLKNYIPTHPPLSGCWLMSQSKADPKDRVPTLELCVCVVILWKWN